MKTRLLFFVTPVVLAAVLRLASAAETTIDMERAKAIHEKEVRGETLSDDERKYLDEAKKQFMARQAASPQGAPPENDGFDWKRARGLYEKKQGGATLSEDDEKFLQEAIKRRQARGGGGGRPGGGGQRPSAPEGSPVADEK